MSDRIIVACSLSNFIDSCHSIIYRSTHQTNLVCKNGQPCQLKSMIRNSLLQLAENKFIQNLRGIWRREKKIKRDQPCQSFKINCFLFHFLNRSVFLKIRFCWPSMGLVHCPFRRSFFSINSLYRKLIDWSKSHVATQLIFMPFCLWHPIHKITWMDSEFSRYYLYRSSTCIQWMRYHTCYFHRHRKKIKNHFAIVNLFEKTNNICSAFIHNSNNSSYLTLFLYFKLLSLPLFLITTLVKWHALLTFRERNDGGKSIDLIWISSRFIEVLLKTLFRHWNTHTNTHNTLMTNWLEKFFKVFISRNAKLIQQL